MFARAPRPGPRARAGFVSSRIAPLAAALTLALVVGPLAPEADAQGFGRNKVQYDDFDWHILETEHFDIYYYPEERELAEIGAQAAEEAYVELENRFAFSFNHRVPMLFYASNLHFKQTNTTPGFIPDGVGGFFEFLKGRVVIPADGNVQRFTRVVQHELVHVFTFNKLARVLRDHRRPVDRFVPLWFTEGLAEYWSGEPDHQHEMIIRDAVASNFFVQLDDMDRIAGSFVMYKEGEAFCRFVAETYGEERILDLIENSWRDDDFSKVVEYVMGEDFHVVSDKWWTWIREQYLPKLEDADVPSLASRPVAARGAHFKPVVHTWPDGRREVLSVANRGGYSEILATPVGADLEPLAKPEVIVRAGKNLDYEAFHLFESRMDVSDDGLLAFVTKRGERDVIHLHDLRQRRRVEMLGFDELVGIYSPTVSADGRQVAFTGIGRNGLADLFLYDRDGGPAGAGLLRQLTRDAYDDRDPDFSPDGLSLAFSSDRTAFAGPGTPIFNIFRYDLETDEIGYITSGPQVDVAPRYSPDGQHLAYVSAHREADGKFSAQNLWVADLSPEAPLDEPFVTASAARRLTAPASGETVTVAFAPDSDTSAEPLAPGSASRGMAPPAVEVRQLTEFTGAAYDPFWADDSTLVFAAFEDFRWTVRAFDADSAFAQPRQRLAVTAPAPSEAWEYPRYAVSDTTRARPYKRRYALDVAGGSFATAATADYNAGGAAIAFSDMLGDDRIYVSAYSSSRIGRSFLDGLNVSATRIHVGRRANVGYGVFRRAGPLFDRGDPDQVDAIPSYQQIHGALGLVSYPLSTFRRVDLSTSLGYSSKELLGDLDGSGGLQFDTLKTLTFSNYMALAHDNALYSMFGPIDGWRANAGVGYSTDLLQSALSYYTLNADVRHYARITNDITFASWGLARANVGRRARYNLIGGSWSARGFPLLRIRAQRLLFTSQELRFPIVKAPYLISPVLGAFGVAGLKGALFVDAAHAWNEDGTGPDLYNLNSQTIGKTFGSVGAGARLNLFGAFVLRYDVGYRFWDGFQFDEREPFTQFFFGYDF
ncbi:peptidase MA family metallohydrolase [Rubricoccus marinus]|uniref:peptidase MA family metallohydrolase n=1 Tax=Rubricoccus marinus TaxID=716817 RepID=UPI000B9996DB|nr:BamA/TamA family outer membrane protein [Rubricoccus marinus]